MTATHTTLGHPAGRPDLGPDALTRVLEVLIVSEVAVLLMLAAAYIVLAIV